MPPKVKITKDDIIRATLDVVRDSGREGINTRKIAAYLGCSTQPLFSNFQSMEELENEVITAAYHIYLSYLKKEAESGKYPEYKSFGMAYIRFAMEERELFKLLFMRDRNGEELNATPDFNASVDLIMNTNGITRERATRMHLEMWSTVHGIATMIATSFLTLDWELISDMISDVYHGIRARHLSEENK